MKMTAAIQEKSGPATDEAIKRFNLDSTVSLALKSVWLLCWSQKTVYFSIRRLGWLS